MTALISQQL